MPAATPLIASDTWGSLTPLRSIRLPATGWVRPIRATMAQPEDVAAAILMCVTLPERTVIEELVVSPTRTRDQSRDIEVARNLGAPPGVK